MSGRGGEVLRPDEGLAEVQDPQWNAARALVRDAVKRACAVQPEWEERAPVVRARALRTVADELRRQSADLASLVADEEGKLVTEASAEIENAAQVLEYYAGLALAPIGSVLPTNGTNRMLFTFRQALGVVAAITPWNFPVNAP